MARSIVVLPPLQSIAPGSTNRNGGAYVGGFQQHRQQQIRWRGVRSLYCTIPESSRSSTRRFRSSVDDKKDQRARRNVRRRYHSDEEAFSLPSFQGSIDKCWSATSWTVNAADDEEVNSLLRCFNSPAQQSFFALTHALENSSQSDEDQVIEILQSFSTQLKRGYQFGIYRNSTDDNKHLVNWTIVGPEHEIVNNSTSKRPFELIQPFEDYPNTISIAHHLLDKVTEASQISHDMDKDDDIESIKHFLVELAVHRLQITLGTDIRSRASADTAFAFATSGVSNADLYKMLTMITQKELERVGPRSSYPSKYILQIIEKLAAAGIEEGKEIKDVYRVAANLLESKSSRHDDVVMALNNQSFGLHSTRPLLWLWRFAARQAKVKVPTTAKKEDIDKKDSSSVDKLKSSTFTTPSSLAWLNNLDNPSRDLVVDVGCGMGVSLLGLATLTNDKLNIDSSGTLDDSSIIDYSQCNFLGCDLNRLLVGYGSSIAERWKIQGKLQFIREPADQCIYGIATTYPGKVKLVMIQFPSPYRLNPSKMDSGNSQLPSVSNFMVSEFLLRSISTLLQNKRGEGEESGYLLIQSNCEDVAVYMRDLAVKKIGMTHVDAESVVDVLPIEELPQRSREWIAMGGKRPMGDPCWSSKPLLPRKGQTETEVACDIQGTPVHRCLLRA